MSKVVSITGLKECYRAIDGMPAAALKVTKTSLREAAKPVAKQMRQGTPKRWRKLIKSKISGNTTLRGGLSATIGFFNGHQISDKGEREDWFKAYWANYGTLKHRDPGHVFQYKVKPRQKNRRNNEGQEAQNFFEQASAGAEQLFLEQFRESFENHLSELVK